jgi:hypothetical protein
LLCIVLFLLGFQDFVKLTKGQGIICKKR